MKYKQTKLKSAWARIRYFLAVLKCRLFKTNDVVICVLVVNNRCDFNCSYCFGSYHQRKTKDYTTAELKQLIDKLYDLGTRYLNLHGGEALLRRDIGEIIDYVKQKGMYCCLITNGSLLPKKIDQVRIVDNLTISFDGTKENNDLNRGEGTYDKALSAIKLAIQEKIPLRVSATITKHTMNDIGYLSKLAKELGFSLFFSILFKPLPQAKDCEMTNEEIQAALKKVLEYKNQGYPVFTSHRAIEYAIDWPLDHNDEHFVTREAFQAKMPDTFKNKHIKCYYGTNKITIEADGNVYPCFLLTDCFKPLNWKEVGIEKAIRHVQMTNDCVACPALSQNDHNLLLGLDPKLIKGVIYDQVKEIMGRK